MAVDESEVKDTVDRFNEAFNRHDVDAVMALMTDDCVFEATGPAPDGRRMEGAASVRQAWVELFRDSANARFDAEDFFLSGDRCCVRWIYHWVNSEGISGHIRGVDVITVRDGKISQKLAYVKG